MLKDFKAYIYIPCNIRSSYLYEIEQDLHKCLEKPFYTINVK